MSYIGIIGAGHIGSQVARLAVANGYDVVISNSRGPETLAGLVAELGPKARADTPLAAAKAGDIVVVTIPLKNYRTVPVEPLTGKIVIDTNNYYWQRDGHIDELDDGSNTSAGLLQDHLPTSRVVKAFNHIRFSELAVDGFFLEYDDERSGGFEPLRFVPPGKMVVLGLVTTKRGALEDKEALKRL